MSTLPWVSTPPRGVPDEVDAAELLALHARDPVVPGQPLVEERVLAVEEVQDAAVLADDALEEQLALPAHREAQVVLEGGEALAVGGHRLQRPELQPLAAERLHQRPRLGVLQHAADLRGQDFAVIVNIAADTGAQRWFE